MSLFKNENKRDYDWCDHEWTPIKVGTATPQCQGSVHGWNVKAKNRWAAIDFSTMPQAERRRSRPCKQQHRKPTSLRMARSPQTKLMSSHEMKSIAPTTLTGASGSCRASPTCDPIQSHWFRPYFKFANPNVIDLLVAVDTLHRPTVLAHIHRTEHIFDSRVRMRW